jgi:hypothetical protein
MTLETCVAQLRDEVTLLNDKFGSIASLGDGVPEALAIAANGNGGFSTAYRRVISDAAATVTAADRVIAYSSLTDARTVTLCAASAFPAGARLLIIDESGSCSPTRSLTISRAGLDTINGLTSAVVGFPYGSICLESNGSNKWAIVDRTILEPERVSLARFVTPGTTNHTAAIQAWWDYILSKLVDSEVQSTPVVGYIPQGVFTATSGLTLDASKYNVQIFGSGWGSRLVNVKIIASKPFFAMSDLTLSGSTGGLDGLVLASGQAKVTRCYIRDKSIGVLCQSGSHSVILNSIIHRCGVGVSYTGGAGGLDLVGTDVLSCTSGGILFQSGGELKINGGHVMSNANYGLKVAYLADSMVEGGLVDRPSESYFHGVTITGNGIGSEAYAVSSIASHSGGDRIAVTLSGPHRLSRGYGKLKLTGTNVVGYDNINTYVYDVLSDTEVVLDLAYVSGAAGVLNGQGFDLIFSGTDVGYNRGMHFIGGNINHTLFNGVYNAQFHGTRLKDRIWMDAGSQNSQIFISRVGPTETYGGGDSDTPQSERVREIPISGPGSVHAWTEVVSSQDGTKTNFGPGGEFIALRAPRAGTGLNPDRTPAAINELRAGTAGTFINGQKFNDYPFEITFSLSNDTATSITIPQGRNSALIHVMVSGSGEPNLTASGLIVLDAGNSLEAAKIQGGSTIEVTTGVLSGTTGNDTKFTVSPASTGLIYFESRMSGTRAVRVRYLN